MKIGAMNHPGRDVVSEIRGMADMKLEFIDLSAPIWSIPNHSDNDAIANRAKYPTSIVSKRFVIIGESNLEQRIHKRLVMRRHDEQIEILGVSPTSGVTGQPESAADHERPA